MLRARKTPSVARLASLLLGLCTLVAMASALSQKQRRRGGARRMNADSYAIGDRKHCLVTGGSGYIGSHTCLVLLEAGYEVRRAALAAFERGFERWAVLQLLWDG